MSELVRFFIQCRVYLSAGDLQGSLSEFEVEAEAHLPLKQLIKEFLVAYHESILEIPEPERPELNIFVDEDTPIEQCVTARVLDENGNYTVLNLDTVPAQEGYPSGTKIEIVPGQFIVGVKIVKAGHRRPAGNGGRSAGPRGGGSVGPPPERATRRARIQNELEQLALLAKANPTLMEIIEPRSISEVWMLSKPLLVRMTVEGWIRNAAGRLEPRLRHDVKVTFPPRYPVDQPFKVACVAGPPPIFHPNVSPEPDADGSGHYICLYTEDVPPNRRTLVEAFVKLEALIAWRAASLNDVDAMNRDAAMLYRDGSSGMCGEGGPRLRPPPQRLFELRASMSTPGIKRLT